VVVFLYKSPYTNIAERLHGTYQEFVEYDSSNVKDGSTTERLEGWHAAWNIFLEHPFLGAGPGSFKPIVHRMIDQGERSEIIRRFSQPHNAYLAVMADCGIPSLISLFAIFLIPAYTIVKQILMDRTGRDAGFAGLYLIAAFAQFGLTETIFGRNINIGFYIVMLAVVLSVSTGYDGVKSIIPPNHTASSRD
jgi:O-antigen ligase